jgi:hypothetical protein
LIASLVTCSLSRHELAEAVCSPATHSPATWRRRHRSAGRRATSCTHTPPVRAELVEGGGSSGHVPVVRRASPAQRHTSRRSGARLTWNTPHGVRGAPRIAPEAGIVILLQDLVLGSGPVRVITLLEHNVPPQEPGAAHAFRRPLPARRATLWWATHLLSRMISWARSSVQAGTTTCSVSSSRAARKQVANGACEPGTRLACF